MTAWGAEFQLTYFIVKAQKLHLAKIHYILLRENSTSLCILQANYFTNS